MSHYKSHYILAYIYRSGVLMRFMVQIRETGCASLAAITLGEYPCLAPFPHYCHALITVTHKNPQVKNLSIFLSLQSHGLITVT